MMHLYNSVKEKRGIIFGLALGLGLGLLIPNFADATTLYQHVAESETNKQIWQSVLSLVDIAAVLGLIIIAFAQILNIDIETYDIKRTLPALIMGVIAANFSYFFCTEIIGFAQTLTDFFLGDAIGPGGLGNKLLGYAFGQFTSTDLTGLVSTLGGGSFIGLGLAVFSVSSALGVAAIAIGVIILLFPLIIWFTLSILLYLRTLIVTFLVITSSVAALLYFLPFTRSIASTWFDWFIKWLFLGPIIGLIVYIMDVTMQAGSATGGSFFGIGQSGDYSIITGFVGTMFLSAIAVYLPYQFVSMGNLLNTLQGLAKGVASAVGIPGLKVVGAKYSNSDTEIGKKIGKGATKLADFLTGEDQPFSEIVDKIHEEAHGDLSKQAMQYFAEDEGRILLVASAIMGQARQQAANYIDQDPSEYVGGLGATAPQTRESVLLGLYHDWEAAEDGSPESERLREALREIGEASGKGADYYDPIAENGIDHITYEGERGENLLSSKISKAAAQRISNIVRDGDGPDDGGDGDGPDGGGPAAGGPPNPRFYYDNFTRAEHDALSLSSSVEEAIKIQPSLEGKDNLENALNGHKRWNMFEDQLVEVNVRPFVDQVRGTENLTELERRARSLAENPTSEGAKRLHKKVTGTNVEEASTIKRGLGEFANAAQAAQGLQSLGAPADHENLTKYRSISKKLSNLGGLISEMKQQDFGSAQAAQQDIGKRFSEVLTSHLRKLPRASSRDIDSVSPQKRESLIEIAFNSYDSESGTIKPEGVDKIIKEATKA